MRKTFMEDFDKAMKNEFNKTLEKLPEGLKIQYRESEAIENLKRLNTYKMENTTKEKLEFKVPTFDNLIINDWDVVVIMMPTREEGIAAKANIIMDTNGAKKPQFRTSRPLVVCKVGKAVNNENSSELNKALSNGTLVYMKNGFEHESNMLAINEHKAWLNPIIVNSMNITAIETDIKWLDEYAELQNKIENFVNENVTKNKTLTTEEISKIIK